MSLTTPPTSVALLRERCNRLVNGECGLRKCMVRGGWTGGDVNYNKATCEYREAVMAIEERDRLREALERIRKETSPLNDDLMDHIYRIADNALHLPAFER